MGPVAREDERRYVEAATPDRVLWSGPPFVLRAIAAELGRFGVTGAAVLFLGLSLGFPQIGGTADQYFLRLSPPEVGYLVVVSALGALAFLLPGLALGVTHLVRARYFVTTSGVIVVEGMFRRRVRRFRVRARTAFPASGSFGGSIELADVPFDELDLNGHLRGKGMGPLRLRGLGERVDDVLRALEQSTHPDPAH